MGSFIFENNKVGYAVIDNSTGEFLCGRTSNNSIINIINEYQLKEIIIPDSQKSYIESILNHNIMLTCYDDWKANYDNCYEKLLNQFKTRSLKGFGIENDKLLISSAGSCLFYLDDNYFNKINHITSISRIKENGYMRLDDFTFKNLEIFHSLTNQNNLGTLISVIDNTNTSMGSRLLKKYLRHPLTDIKKINSRLDIIDELIQNKDILDLIREKLKNVFDIERIISKIANDKTNPVDVFNLSNSLLVIEDLNQLIKNKYKYLNKIFYKRNDLNGLIKLIKKYIVENPPINFNKGCYINEGISKKLDEYRLISNDANQWLIDYQIEQKEKTGIPSLKIKYNKIFGYYIDVTKTHLNKIPDNYIRKQTLTNSERFFTVELKEYEEKILYSNDKSLELEKEIFKKLENKIVSNFLKIQNNAKILAMLDVAVSNSLLAIDSNYCRPTFNKNSDLELLNARHPVVEKLLPLNEDFISNDLLLKKNKRHLGIITGPNMSGKSTYLRQVGLIVLLAQIGAYVPADKCVLGIVDQLFTRVGANDNLSGGESTFLVEMNESANILNNATSKSLIILDEIGRGTSTFDGLSLAWAITEYIHNNNRIKARTLFATHYHELIYLAEKLSGAFNLNVEVVEDNDKVVFLRKINDGGASKSYGIQVAEMAGLPKSIILRAKTLLSEFTKDKKNITTLEVNTNQLDLFDNKNKVINKIKKIDIENLSPIDALNILNNIKKDLK